jgi:tetratricopeptide (TPR) repeat protein
VGDFSLGRVLTRKQQFAAAAESFRKSAAVRPDDPLPLEALVRTLTATGRTGEAIALLTQQAGSDQKGLFAKFLLGGIYSTQGDLPKARKYLEEVVTAKPDSIGAWIGLAGTYTKDRDARIRVLERAWQANPDQVDISMPLATALELAGRIEEAISIYEKVLKVNPGFEVAINNLASLLLDPGNNKANVQRALKLAKELAKTDNPALLDTLGWAHYRSGNDREAVSVLERVVATAGQFPVFRYHLGMAYFAVGNKVAAKQELTKAVNDAEGEYPGIDEARRTLKQLESTAPAANVPKGPPGPG